VRYRHEEGPAGEYTPAEMLLEGHCVAARARRPAAVFIDPARWMLSGGSRWSSPLLDDFNQSRGNGRSPRIWIDALVRPGGKRRR